MVKQAASLVSASGTVTRTIVSYDYVCLWYEYVHHEKYHFKVVIIL